MRHLKTLFCITALFLGCQGVLAQSKDKVRLQLRTNTLYYLALSPNVSAEVQTKCGLALQAGVIGAWWNSYKTNRFLQNFILDSECRYYFNKKESEQGYFTKHHVGVYGQLIAYDLELGKQGIICPRLIDSWSCGLSYGYNMPVTNNLSLDFTLGVGFLRSQYMKYLPYQHGWYLDSKNIFKGVLPTKVEICLVWTINGKKPVVMETDEKRYY